MRITYGKGFAPTLFMTGKVLVLVIKLVLPAEPAVVTKFTLIVAADALILVAVNLSMMAVTPVAVYWVV